MMTITTPVILSGGAGTRLWPVSTEKRPKQFLTLTGTTSLFQQAVSRVSDTRKFAPPIIVANAAHTDLIALQLAEMGIDSYRIIVETAGRNTAPAIALAALSMDSPDTPMLILPSDQVIADQPAFAAAVEAAIPKALEGWLFTFGLEPTAPETGYGYLKTGKSMGGKVYEVAEFVEKPDVVQANRMLDDGSYRWNAGIFLMRNDVYLNALKRYAPEIHRCCFHAIDNSEKRANCLFPDAAIFAASPSDSIDYAIMEKAEKVAMVSVAMGWSDLGNWNALYEISEHDEDGNTVQGNGTFVNSNCCFVRSENAHVSLLGVNDLVVIAEGNEIIILPREQVQRVKELAALKKKRCSQNFSG